MKYTIKNLIKNFNTLPETFSIYRKLPEDTSKMTYCRDDNSWVINQEDFKYFL